MKLVALLEAPADRERAATLLAESASLTAAEARMRLAAEPPALLARLDDAPSQALCHALEAAGIPALALDAAVPTDADRTVARTLTLGDHAVTFAPRSAPAQIVPYAEIGLILRGIRLTREETARTETQRKLSVSTAILTQGMKLSRTERKEIRTVDEQAEHFLLVYPREGRCAAVYDGQVAFACLGPAVQPTKLANILHVASTLREKAPQARYDERLVRLGKRSLPFLPNSEQQLVTATLMQRRSDTARSVDVLAEILRLASLRAGA